MNPPSIGPSIVAVTLLSCHILSSGNGLSIAIVVIHSITMAINLAKACLDLVLNVHFEEGDGVLGSCSRVRPMIDRGRDDIPFPIRATIHWDTMPPLFQGWRERVDLCQGLRLH